MWALLMRTDKLAGTYCGTLPAVQPLEADDRPKILCEFVTQVLACIIPW